MHNIWDERYAGDDYFFGTEPNAFLVTQSHLLKPGMSCLAVADGEGRNGVWLAQNGLQVLSVEASAVALEKAKNLARQRGVTDGTTRHLTRLPNYASQVIGYVEFEQADLAQWEWGESRFDVVAAIFIQFAPPALREQMFAGIKHCLKPGGLLLLQGYTPRQLEYKTGGPPVAENMYTEALLRKAFSDMEILHLREHDDRISEGMGHSGMSALIDLAARKIT
jgi:cyclopropane fatty-acyl-phospholipid synthase-like methyltransferase